MAVRRTILLPAAMLAVVVGGYLLYGAIARQGSSTLGIAQSPLNIQSQAKPAFIMAVDNSGSMTFQTQFPGADGEACWDTSSKSYFNSDGTLRTSGSCNYFYVLPGPRVNNYPGIPPLDTLGFARSPDFNPTFFNPTVKYGPWAKGDGTTYGNAALTNTLIDVRATTGINLSASRFDTTSDSFRIQNGMIIPSGLQYRWNNRNATTTGDLTWNSGAGTIYIEYVPSTFFLKWTSDNDPRPAPADAPTAYDSVPRTKISNACGTGCAMWKYQIRAQDTEALQNFANWFSYYGNRNRAMIAGMTLSMADVNNMRVGYFTINTAAGDTNYSAITMRDMADATQKSALYTDMLALNASGGTPNLYAVDFIGKQFQRKLATDTGAPIQLQCQRNGGMLFTDGYSNSGTPGAAVPTDASVTGIPFDPTPLNSMAAIASKYYVTNLNTDMPAGKVTVPEECATLDASSIAWKRLDCQTNLHMNFYGITLGAGGDLYNPSANPAQDPYTDASVYGRWPGYTADTRSTVDDIWHATVNTRGRYINARTPVEITSAMREILGLAAGGETPSGSVGLTGARVGNGSLTITPAYQVTNNATDWYSTLTAETVSSDSLTGVATFTPIWEASKKLSYAGRNIRFGKTAASGIVPSLNDFNTANVALADLCMDSLKNCNTAASGKGSIVALTTLAGAVDYLRGDRTGETLATKPLRKRSSILGDIVNSIPVISSPLDDYGYTSLGGTLASSYTTYLAGKRNAAASRVYIGANDGMLHAFDGTNTTAGGNEIFAYVPSTALGHMGNLLFPYNASDKNDQVFQHRYYVDGPLVVSDANYGGSWKTVLVGTSGAGGRSVFALDVTGGSLGKVLWEISDQVSDTTIKNSIGHALGKPVIVPVKDTAGNVKWKAIFGNGYGSANNKAVLFVVDIDGTAAGNVTMIEAEETSPPTNATGSVLPNGLGNIVVLDRFTGTVAGRDGYADTVYAGDQNGAIWKFDLVNPTQQTKPFFIAKSEYNNSAADGPFADRQAILGGIEAASGPGGGVMLYFGTGSFSFQGDPTDRQMQTLYGVLDKGIAVSGRSALQKQTIISGTDDRQVSVLPLGLGKLGWYLDLGVSGTGNPVATGERFIGYPQLEGGVVFFPTFDPSRTSDCTTDGANRLYGLSALSGAAALSNLRIGSPLGTQPGVGTGAVKLNTGGTAPVKDVAVMAVPRIMPLGTGATAAQQAAAVAAQCSTVIQVAGSPPLYMPRPCGRQSWRQVR